MVLFYCLVTIGAIVCGFGFYIWFNQAIQFVSRHANVSDDNIEQFVKLNGICTVEFGTALLFSGICGIMNLFIPGVMIFLICFTVSIILYFYGQAKYNRF
jgi:hypothetical protein